MERIRDDVASEGGAGRGEADGDPAEGAQAEIFRLRKRHAEIEQRLVELDRHLSLTPDEQVERARLKKEKLWSKDRMTILAHHVQAA